MAKSSNETPKHLNNNKEDIIDFEFTDLPANPFVVPINNLHTCQQLFTSIAKEIKSSLYVFVCKDHAKCTNIINKLRFLLENCVNLNELYYNDDYYRKTTIDDVLYKILLNLSSSSCLFHHYKTILYITKLIITRFYKFTNITIMPIIVQVKDLFDLYIHCIKSEIIKNNKEEFIIELNKVFKYLKLLIELAQDKNKDRLNEIRQYNSRDESYSNYRLLNHSCIMFNTIYNLPSHMDKESFERYYENLKSVFESFNKIENQINKYIEYGIINDFQELINYIIDNKIKVKYEHLVLSLVYGNVEMAKTFILHGCKMSKNILNEVLEQLLNENTYNILLKKKYKIKFEPFQFMIENGSEYNKDLVIKFFQKYHSYDTHNKYSNNNLLISSEIVSLIANCIFTTKDCLTLDELIKFTENRIIINSPIKLGLDINCDKFREFCTKIEYNPYNIKEKLSLEQLREACFKTNITKVKKICKVIKPDIECLRNACINKLNKTLVKYLVEEHGLQFDETCLVNALYGCHTTLSYYISNKYKQQNANKLSKENTNKEIAKLLISDYNSLSENEEENNKENIKEIIIETTDNNKKDNNKEDIKETIIETTDNNTTNVNTNTNTNTKVKKIIRKRIVKVKSDSTKSDNSTTSNNLNNLNKDIIQDNQDTTQLNQPIKVTNKTKIIRKKTVKVNKIDSVKEDNHEENEEKKEEVKFKTIPDNYNFRKLNKIKENIKNILKIKKSEISFNNLREEILNYLNINKLFNGDKINIKDFKLNIQEVDFNNLDDFIYNLYD
jgi:hypothetical protein